MLENAGHCSKLLQTACSAVTCLVLYVGCWSRGGGPAARGWEKRIEPLESADKRRKAPKSA
eukprot:4727336-Alexandrium_andersonii.AAC.1